MSHSHIKPKRSLKKPDTKRKSTPENALPNQNVLPIDIDKQSLDSIFANIALNNDPNPQEAFAQVYALALDAIAKTLKSAIASFADQSTELPPLLAKLIPAGSASATKALVQSLSEKVDLSKDKICASLSQTTQASKARGNYREFSNTVRESGLAAMFGHNNNPLPNHLPESRLREIYDASIQCAPIQSSAGKYTIDLNQIPREMHFHVGTPTPSLTIKDSAGNTVTKIDHSILCNDSISKAVDILSKQENGEISSEQTVELCKEAIKTATNSETAADELSAPNASEETVQRILRETTKQNFVNDPAIQSLNEVTHELQGAIDDITVIMTDLADQLTDALLKENEAHVEECEESNDDEPLFSAEIEDFLNSYSDEDTDEEALAFMKKLDEEVALIQSDGTSSDEKISNILNNIRQQAETKE